MTKTMQTTDLFIGFSKENINIDPDTRLFVRQKPGEKTPILLLHGYPQTHLIWRHIAPRLAELGHYVIAPDLKGYGDSDAPVPLPDASNYSRQAMGWDMIHLLDTLKIDQCIIIGHDRGARVTYRMALDHPDRIKACAVLDILPTVEFWDVADREFMMDVFHWAYLAQPRNLSQHMIGLDPDFWHDWIMRHWAKDMSAFPDEIISEYRRCFRRKEVIAATCADYLAGATIDVEHDQHDRASGKKITCPLLALWSGTYSQTESNALQVWKKWAREVSGQGFPAGHFLPEEAPDLIFPAIAAWLSAFVE